MTAKLKLDSNECEHPFFPTNSVEDFIHNARINRYQTPIALEVRLANRHATDPSRLVVTAGADEALARICTAFLAYDTHFITTTPNFPMLLPYAQQSTSLISTFSWLMPNQPFPVEAVIDAIRPNTRLIVLVSPNNPTGQCIAPQDIFRIAQALPHGIVVVDQVYADFADEGPVSMLLNYGNIAVVRSLSKSWGLAGLRIGYIMGAPNIIEKLRSVAGPFPVSTLSLKFVLDHFGELENFARDYVLRIKIERDELNACLQDLGFETWSTQANFVLCRGDLAEILYKSLHSRGVLLKWLGSLSPTMKNCLRITCPGNSVDFQYLISSITKFRQQSELSENI